MILIDIPMPRCCLNCVCANSYADSPFWDVYCKPLQRYIDESQTEHRQDDCPLKEVVQCGDCVSWENNRCLQTCATAFESDFCSFGEREEDGKDD